VSAARGTLEEFLDAQLVELGIPVDDADVRALTEGVALWLESLYDDPAVSAQVNSQALRRNSQPLRAYWSRSTLEGLAELLRA
jgi:hypothetical protein